MNRLAFKKLELSINRGGSNNNHQYLQLSPQGGLRTEESLTVASIADDQTQYIESPTKKKEKSSTKRRGRADPASPAPIDLAALDGA